MKEHKLYLEQSTLFQKTEAVNTITVYKNIQYALLVLISEVCESAFLPSLPVCDEEKLTEFTFNQSCAWNPQEPLSLMLLQAALRHKIEITHTENVKFSKIKK